MLILFLVLKLLPVDPVYVFFTFCFCIFFMVLCLHSLIPLMFGMVTMSLYSSCLRFVVWGLFCFCSVFLSFWLAVLLLLWPILDTGNVSVRLVCVFPPLVCLLPHWWCWPVHKVSSQICVLWGVLMSRDSIGLCVWGFLYTVIFIPASYLWFLFMSRKFMVRFVSSSRVNFDSQCCPCC